jgi:hypothetical protein
LCLCYHSYSGGPLSCSTPRDSLGLLAAPPLRILQSLAASGGFFVFAGCPGNPRRVCAGLNM